ncbi:MAG: DUF885 domain-containing protein [Gemmatimonadota bacterium]
MTRSWFAASPFPVLALTVLAPFASAAGGVAQVPGDGPTETDRLNAWFAQKWEEQLAFSPIQQTILGMPSGEIDDMSLAAGRRQLEWRRNSVAEMRASFDYDLLSDEGKTSWDVFVYQWEKAEAADAYPLHAYVFDQMSATPHTFLPQVLIAFHRVDGPEDMENYVNRIGESARAIRQLIERSRMAADKGIRPPAFAFDYVIDEATKVIHGVPFDDGPDDNEVWADANAKIEALLEDGRIDEERAQAFAEEVRAALTGPWHEAYRELIAWQEEDRVHASEEARGAWALPDGEAYYDERLANWTTTKLTAEEIHRIGLAEVARLRAEMEAIKDQVGFEGSLVEFFAELRDDKDNRTYYYPDTDEGRQAYLDDATAAIEGIEAALPDYFGILPRAGLVVKRVESFREQPGAAQHYAPSTPDGSRPGVYYAHLSDMTSMPKSDLEAIAYHEGLPGHHMQLAIAQELEDIPTFRTQAFFGAYVEGWGLYAEWLAKEMPGTFRDPYSDFGRLSSEIWRAVRLVVDTGIHGKGWSEEEAVRYATENSSVTEGRARSEVRRYIVWPGQATSYKVGMLKMQELRRKAEDALGDDFDIRGFHDTILGGGALPLSILEKRVDRWIARERGAVS